MDQKKFLEILNKSFKNANLSDNIYDNHKKNRAIPMNKSLRVLKNFYKENTEIENKIKELKKKKEDLTLDQYQKEMMDLANNKLNNGELLRKLNINFKDVKKMQDINYFKTKNRKLAWTEIINKISHCVPYYLIKKFEEQK